MDQDQIKKELRARAKEARARAHAVHGSGAGAQLASVPLAEIAPAWPCVVSGFLPIGEEIDPVPLMRAAEAGGCTLALPVILKKATPLTFRRWAAEDVLVERMWGIREPSEASPEVLPDVLLVPLLAFDAEGYRLGYGGGFYDRSLAKLRALKPVTAVGIAYDEQAFDAVPRDRYDEPCDYILTPSGLHDCCGAARSTGPA